MKIPHHYFLDEPISLIRQVNHKEANNFVGCSNAEIEHLEQSLPDGYKLPAAYKEFLMAGGHEFGPLFWWTHMGYEDVLAIAKSKNVGWAEYVLDPPKIFDSKVFIIEDGDGLFF